MPIRILFPGLLLLFISAPFATPAIAGTLHPSQIEEMLRERGFIAPAPSARAVKSIVPPASTEVDERIQTNSKTGTELSRIKSSTETVGANLLYIELTTLPKNQHSVAFWVFPKGSPGCSAFGLTMYDTNGRVLTSSFWRNDPAMRIAGAANFPPDIYPDSVPPAAFVRVLGAIQDGAKGELNQQISPYGYVGQTVRVECVQRITVAAGTFSAFKVSTTPDVSTLMPSWPRFVLSAIRSFIPTSRYYFDYHAPYRMLRQEGTLAAGGPEVTTELVRFYIAGARATNALSTLAPSFP